MKPPRHRTTRPRLHKILICCEGQSTEPRYLYDFKQAHKECQDLDIIFKSSKGGDANAVVQAAIDERNSKPNYPERYDEVWCVLDAEDASRAPVLKQALADAEAAGLRVVVSNPSFEVWLIAHFERIARPFRDGTEAKNYFERKHWRPLTGRDYVESDPAIYLLLQDKVQTACAHAHWVKRVAHNGKECRDANSSTDVYTLIQRLLSEPPAAP